MVWWSGWFFLLRHIEGMRLIAFRSVGGGGECVLVEFACEGYILIFYSNLSPNKCNISLPYLIRVYKLQSISPYCTLVNTSYRPSLSILPSLLQLSSIDSQLCLSYILSGGLASSSYLCWSELKRLIPQLIQQPFYLLMRYVMRHWPLDASFRLVNIYHYIDKWVSFSWLG